MDKMAFLNFLSDVKLAGGNGADAANLIKRASGEDVDPHELEQIMGQMPQGEDGGPSSSSPAEGSPMGGAEMAPPAPEHAEHPAHAHHKAPSHLQLSDEELDTLAAQIAQHLAEQSQGGAAPDPSAVPPGAGAGAPPMDPMAGLPPEAAAGLANVKSASYIAGFLKEGMANGLDVESAVNIYGEQLNNTISIMKEAAERESDLSKLASNEKLSTETLAYFEGVLEKAASMGMSYEDTVTFLHNAGVGKQLIEQLS